MSSVIDKINGYITGGSKNLNGPKMAALLSAFLRIISTTGNLIVGWTQKAVDGCSREMELNVACLAKMWKNVSTQHGWNTFFNILDCFAMILMIWVFDGLRTINKDKDIGTLMVGCMEIATVINVVTTLIETGVTNTARWISRDWTSKWTDQKYYADLQIAYLLARGAFAWLFTIDDFIMVIPYFWAFMLASQNDRMPKTFAVESASLAVLSFIYFLFGIFELNSVAAFVCMVIVGILYLVIRFIWLFHAYSIFKRME